MEIEINTVANTESEPLTFVRWYEQAKEQEEWTYEFRAFSVNDEKGCVTFFGTDNTASTFYVEHATNAKFTDTTPEGVRVLRALGRFAGMKKAFNTEFLQQQYRTELLVAGPLALNMTRTDKGRLWTILDVQGEEE